MSVPEDQSICGLCVVSQKEPGITIKKMDLLTWLPETRRVSDVEWAAVLPLSEVVVEVDEGETCFPCQVLVDERVIRARIQQKGDQKQGLSSEETFS